MKIGVVTTTRAEYGVLKPLIKKINEDPDTELNLIVTGTHLIDEFGYTIKYIEEDGFPITKKLLWKFVQMIRFQFRKLWEDISYHLQVSLKNCNWIF